jgi:biotin carboxyl carrier protein
MSIIIHGASATYQAEKSEKGFTLKGYPSEFTLNWIKKPDLLHVVYNNQSYTAIIHKFIREEKTLVLTVGMKKFTLTLADEHDQLLKSLGLDKLIKKGAENLKAPMPGMVLKVMVNAGDVLKKGDQVLILEAMKMENIIKAPNDVKIKSIAVKEKQAVDKNQLLIEFEA